MFSARDLEHQRTVPLETKCTEWPLTPPTKRSNCRCLVPSMTSIWKVLWTVLNSLSTSQPLKSKVWIQLSKHIQYTRQENAAKSQYHYMNQNIYFLIGYFVQVVEYKRVIFLFNFLKRCLFCVLILQTSSQIWNAASFQENICRILPGTNDQIWKAKA